MSSPSQHERHMRRCIELARQAIKSGDSPVGSLIVDGDELVSEGVEAVRARQDATAHAEMEALLSCARSGVSTRGATLYSTTFPCHNCAKHIIAAGVARVTRSAGGLG